MKAREESRRPLLILFFSISFWVGTLCASAGAEIKSLFFVTSDGVRLHYLEAGEGKALIFIPGWTMPAEIWEPRSNISRRNFMSLP